MKKTTKFSLLTCACALLLPLLASAAQTITSSDLSVTWNANAPACTLTNHNLTIDLPQAFIGMTWKTYAAANVSTFEDNKVGHNGSIFKVRPAVQTPTFTVECLTTQNVPLSIWMHQSVGFETPNSVGAKFTKQDATTFGDLISLPTLTMLNNVVQPERSFYDQNGSNLKPLFTSTGNSGSSGARTVGWALNVGAWNGDDEAVMNTFSTTGTYTSKLTINVSY